MKHGKGKLYDPDGGLVIGTWHNDRLNGLVQRCRAGSAKRESVIYKNDMLIRTSEF